MEVGGRLEPFKAPHASHLDEDAAFSSVQAKHDQGALRAADETAAGCCSSEVVAAAAAAFSAAAPPMTGGDVREAGTGGERGAGCGCAGKVTASCARMMRGGKDVGLIQRLPIFCCITSTD